MIVSKIDMKGKLMDNFGPRMLGGMMIFSGISIWFNPVFHSSKFLMTFDFTEIKIPMCLFLIILGSLFICTTFRGKK